MRNIVTATSNTNTYETNKKSSEKQKKNRRQTTENVIEIEYRTTPPIRTSYKYSSLAGMNVNQFLLNLLKHWNRLHGLYEVLLVYFQCVHEQRREKKTKSTRATKQPMTQNGGTNDKRREGGNDEERGKETRFLRYTFLDSGLVWTTTNINAPGKFVFYMLDNKYDVW